MAARSKARHRALDVLYEADLRSRPLADVLHDLQERRSAEGNPPLNPLTVSLVQGVENHRSEVDDVISTYAIGWTLDRMPLVDRNILRLATYEILYSDEVPGPVAVSEAVELAKQFAGDSSPKFINGLLARVLQLQSDQPEAVNE